MSKQHILRPEGPETRLHLETMCVLFVFGCSSRHIEMD